MKKNGYAIQELLILFALTILIFLMKQVYNDRQNKKCLKVK